VKSLLSEDEILFIIRASWPDMTSECGWDYPEPCYWGGLLCEEGSVFELRIYPQGGCSINGVIPPEMGLLTNLSFIQMSGLNLSGPIPPELGNLSNLQVM